MPPGSTPAITSSMPTSPATARRGALVVAGQQHRCSPSARSWPPPPPTVGLTVSATASTPRAWPSQPTPTAVWPSASAAAARPASSGARRRRASPRASQARPADDDGVARRPRRTPSPAAANSRDVADVGRPAGASRRRGRGRARAGCDRGGDRVLGGGLDRAGQPQQLGPRPRRGGDVRRRSSGRWSPCRSCRARRVDAGGWTRAPPGPGSGCRAGRRGRCRPAARWAWPGPARTGRR